MFGAVHDREIMSAGSAAYDSKDWKPIAGRGNSAGFWSGVWRRWMGPKRRAVNPSPTPELPHPLDRLSFHDGTLWEIGEGGICREYMALSGVEVIAKRSLRERPDRRWEYRFELNLATDPAWQFYFRRLRCPVATEFLDRELVIACWPEELGSSYAAVKIFLARANQFYAAERENLITSVIAREEGLAAAREGVAKRVRELQRSFDGLQL